MDSQPRFLRIFKRRLKKALSRFCLLPPLLALLRRAPRQGKRLAQALTRLKGACLSPKEKADIFLIEAERTGLLNRQEPLAQNFEDKSLPHGSKPIHQICLASKPFKQALALYQLIRSLKPHNVLELGTNLGISASYLALALQHNGAGRLTTLEGSPYRLAIAREIHNRLNLKNITHVEGFFEDTLESTLKQIGPVDFIFLDGNHQYQPTLDYFERIILKAAPDAVFVFDDIRWSQGMERAWQQLRADTRLGLTLDLDRIGIGVKAANPSGRRFHPPALWSFFDYAVGIDANELGLTPARPGFRVRPAAGRPGAGTSICPGGSGHTPAP